MQIECDVVREHALRSDHMGSCSGLPSGPRGTHSPMMKRALGLSEGHWRVCSVCYAFKRVLLSELPI